ncbi:MAG: tRNA 2-thiouridine(34) synthase MnmA [Cyanobacteria bacterium SIG28]|nr:tRNA 2-thiouridine(34) synthase MnmA [Cyanobacteria bacterium SIG28]
MTKVAVALSGGVDSAVVASLLLSQGYEVVGITGLMTNSDDFKTVANNAKKVADTLGIEHFVVDVTRDFEQYVTKYFEDSYKNGYTPNPCIMCNKYIKWGKLFEYALEVLNADYIATGHYANIKNEGGVYKLYPASDEHKDQLYFLFSLNQKMLSKTLFPLAGYKKSEVKAIAEKCNLPPKSAKESQDICFIKAPMTTKKYLNNLFDIQKGNFVEKSTGKILGQHEGFWQYTIGQRKGIGIAAPQPLYVVEINAETNTVFVGYKEELYSKKLILKNIEWSYPIFEKELEVLVKIRYNMGFAKALVKTSDVGYIVEFESPISAITLGQACVFYDIKDGHLLGGGFI